MQPGQQIGHYRVLDALGTGAQGAVYRAEDLHLHRTVALDNILKPLLMGRGVEVPMLVILIGSIGYELAQAWLREPVLEPVAAEEAG